MTMRINNNQKRLSSANSLYLKDFIKIVTPQNTCQSRIHKQSLQKSMNELLNNEHQSTRRRVAEGIVVLEDSRRQEKNQKRVVESDRMGITFNYTLSSRNNKLNTSLEQEAEVIKDSGIRQTEGDIQLPLHLNVFLGSKISSSRRRLSRFDMRTSFQFSRSIERNIFFIAGQDSLSKKIRQGKKLTQNKIRKNSNHTQQNERIFQDLCHRILDSQMKYTLKHSLDSKSRNGYLKNNDSCSFNHSYERLPIYYPVDRQKSKEKFQKIVKTAAFQKNKINITHNKPNLSQVIHFKQNKQKIKSKYQIYIPRVTDHEFSIDKNKKQKIKMTNDWVQLKRRIEKYQFIRKNLKQAELFKIYQHLKRNKINQDKWPLFIIDEAYKKINGFRR